MTKTQRIERNLQQTVDGIKAGKVQEVSTSLAIIAQCQIDINYTLALLLEEIKDEKAQTIPLERIKKAREEIEKKIHEYCGSGNEVTQAYCDGFKSSLAIINKVMEESEG